MTNYQIDTLIGLVAGILAAQWKEEKIPMFIFTSIACYWMILAIISCIKGL